MVLATPAWLRMPTPTTLILATFESVVISAKPISPRLGLQHRLRARQFAARER